MLRTAALCLAVATATPTFAECPTKEDVALDGVWLVYDDASWIHVRQVDDETVREVEHRAGSDITETDLIGGVVPVRFSEIRPSGKRVLVSRVDYPEIASAFPIVASGVRSLSGQREFTEAAFAAEPASVEGVRAELTMGPEDVLKVGTCSYRSIPVATEQLLGRPTVYYSNLFLPDLGVRVFQSAGQAPIPELFRFRLRAILRERP